MAFLLNFIVVLSVLILALAYFLYVPLPDGAVEPMKQRMGMGLTKLVMSLSRFGEYIGYDTKWNILNNIITLKTKLRAKLDDADVLQVTDTEFDGVRVRIYRPTQRAVSKLPGLLFFHGGGWVLMDIDKYDPLTREIAKLTGVIVVSVDYRLAPKHPFPIPLDDCMTATLHLLHNADKYGVDKHRIGVAGDSSGGNLAMAVSLRMLREKDQSLPKLRLQALAYPALQVIDFNTPSYVTYSSNGYSVLNKNMMIDFWLSYADGKVDLKKFRQYEDNEHTSPALKQSKYSKYVSHSLLPEYYRSVVKQPIRMDFGNVTLSNEIERTILNPDYAPLMAPDEDIARLPTTHVLTAMFDGLRDDGFMLVRRLQDNKVKVDHRHWEGVEHGFLGQQYKTSVKARAEFSSWIKQTLYE